MAMRSVMGVVSGSSVGRFIIDGSVSRSSSVFTRYLSNDGAGAGKGRVLSEEERAKETVYIQKMEKERLEKLKRQKEKDNVEKGKESAEKKSE